MEELSDSLELILEKGTSVVAVTPEAMEYLDETSIKFDTSLKIITDTKMEILNAYKVTFKVDVTSSGKNQIWGEKVNGYDGNNGANLPVSATNIINQIGTIRYGFFNENYKQRVSVKTLLKNL